jgi:anti-sigma regulatory factor (Ser/Thr protein kinase)
MPGQPGPPTGGAILDFETQRPAEEKAEFFRKLRAAAAEQGWPAAVASEVELIFEEWITDVLAYGLAAGKDRFFRVQIFDEEPWARLVVTDNGIPFDPTSMPPPDLSVAPEDRPIGGLGIFMMRNLAASMSYERKGPENILTIRKSLREPMLKSARVA